MKIIADIGASHGGARGRFHALIRAAKDAGADMVKVQFYDPDWLADARRDKLGDPIIWNGESISLRDLYWRAHTPVEWFEDLFEWAETLVGIPLFSSVFDKGGVDTLEAMGCPIYKVSSYEGSDVGLIEHARATGKPVIVSNPTTQLPPDVAVLHCVSKYPCPDDEANVERITELKRTHPIVGFSDHTLGTKAALAAKDLGAVIFEKHIKLEGDTTSPDSGFALEPRAFAAYVTALRG